MRKIDNNNYQEDYNESAQNIKSVLLSFGSCYKYIFDISNMQNK